MRYVCVENRNQMSFNPICMDDYIEEGNICRVIDAYVKSLDMLELGFKYAKPKDTGRKPYNPASMLMLYIYGYLNRIRSSRMLEAETKRNIEVMWLLEKASPDDKTICNFRKDNAAALKNVFKSFSIFCNNQGLYGKRLVAVDGTKIRANNSRRNIHTQKGTVKELVLVNERINKYMNLLEENDAKEFGVSKISKEEVEKALQNLREKKDRLVNWLGKIENNNHCEISTVDSDCRMMHQGGNGRALDACYNVQTITDAKNKLILDFEVSTCPDDKGAIFKLCRDAQKLMNVSELSVVADKGYYDGQDISECEKFQIKCYIPKTNDSKHAPNPDYDLKNFNYIPQKDCYICPQGNILPFRQYNGNAGSGRKWRVYYNTEVCKVCPKRELCTTCKSCGRRIYRNPEQDILDTVDNRMISDEGRKIFRERKKIIEHQFGTVKRSWNYGNFLCRGREKTTGEQALAFLAYNFRRVFNIFKNNGTDLVASLT